MTRPLPSWLNACLHALALLAFLQIGAGVYLALSYKATLVQAAPTAAAHEASWVRSFHYVGSQTMLILFGISLVSLLFLKAYADRPKLWLTTLTLGLATFAAQITGNLLPMQRHDVQTAVIESGIGGRVPLVGSLVSNTMLQGDTFGQPTLDAWFTVHRYVLTVLFLVFGTLLLTELSGGKKKSSPGPSLAIVAVIALVSIFAKAPTGSPAVESDYASHEAVVSWYSWPMHGALNGFEALSPGLGWIGAALLPGLLVGLLFALPLLSKKLSAMVCQGSVVLLLAVFGGLAIAYGGNFEPPFGNQDPPTPQKAVTTVIPVDEALVAKGKALFKANGCVNCHKLDESKKGTDLNNEWKKNRAPAWYVKFINNPKSVRPSTTMPAFSKLSESARLALADYVRKPRKLRGSR